MEPTRLVDGDGDGFEINMLAAARRDLPPAGAVGRAIAAVGVSTTAAAAASSAAGVGAKATASAASASVIAKWVGIGAAVGFVASSGLRFAADPDLRAELLRRTSSVSAPPVPVPRAAPPRAAVNARTEAQKGNEEPVHVAQEAPALPVEKPKPARLPPPATVRPAPLPVASPVEGVASVAAPPPSIANEIQLVERARQGVVGHDPAAAIRALSEYDAVRRTSVLAAEAEVLRVEALLELGQKDRALALAAGALLHAPNGPHAARFREIVAVGQ